MNDQLAVALVFMSGFAAIFGLFYLRNRENMAIIEKGWNPRNQVQRPAPYRSLKWGLLVLGAGLGLLFGYLLTKQFIPNNDNPVMYMSMLGVCGGLGLIVSYWIEKKETMANKNSNDEAV